MVIKRGWRKVFDWTYTYTKTSQCGVEEQTLSIPVHHQFSPGGTDRFRVSLEHEGIEEHGDDVSALKARVLDRLKEHYETAWHKQLYVTVCTVDLGLLNHSVNTLTTEEVEFARRGSECVYRKKHKLHGAIYECEPPKVGPFYGLNWKPSDGPEDMIGSLVDDTPRNRAALHALRYGLLQVGQFFALLVHPNNISGTLSRLLEGSNIPLGEIAPVPHQTVIELDDAGQFELEQQKVA